MKLTSRKWFLSSRSKNVVIEKPIHVFICLKIKMKTLLQTPKFIGCEESAKVEVIESHHNFDSTFILLPTCN